MSTYISDLIHGYLCGAIVKGDRDGDRGPDWPTGAWSRGYRLGIEAQGLVLAIDTLGESWRQVREREAKSQHGV